MTKLKMMAAVAGLALATAAAPASAADFVLDLTGNGSSANYKDYSFKLDGKVVKARATAWSTNAAGSSTVYDAKLGFYSAGLGVINDKETGYGNTHTVDNQFGQDFVVFQFDTAVTLSKIKTTPFDVGGSYDTDVLVAWGTAGTAWNQSLGLNGKSVSTLNAMLSGGQELAGGSGTSTRAVSGGASNLWLVAAGNNLGGDGRIDGFKLANVTVSSAVPEPATWMMMIGGFGVVGAAMRRRKSVTTGAAIA